jgi:hypothetical protein
MGQLKFHRLAAMRSHAMLGSLGVAGTNRLDQPQMLSRRTFHLVCKRAATCEYADELIRAQRLDEGTNPRELRDSQMKF